MFQESDDEIEETSYQKTDDLTEDGTSKISQRLKSQRSLGSVSLLYEIPYLLFI